MVIQHQDTRAEDAQPSLGLVFAALWANAVAILWAVAVLVGVDEAIRDILVGVVILNVSLIGLFAIFKEGRPQYRVVSIPLLNALFWMGWLTGWIVGVVTVVQGALAV